MFGHFIKKYKSLKGQYMNRSPKGKWLLILNMAIFAQKLTGGEILDTNFKLWWFSYVPGIAFIDIVCSFSYTIWRYADEPLKGLLFIAMIGIFIPTTMMYVVIFTPSQRNELRSLIRFAGEKIYPDFKTECSQRYMRICEQSAIKLLLTTIKMIGIINVSSAIFPFFALLTLVMYGEVTLAIPVLFPFTDIETVKGFLINLVNQIIIGVLGLAGNIGIEISACLIKNSVWIFTAAICYAVDEITETIEDPILDSEQASVDRFNRIDYSFRNILAQVQDFDRFLIRLGSVLYWRLLFQSILLTYGISIALFFYLYGVWMSGLGAALFSYTQLYIQCDLGNEIQTANERLVLKLHEMPWYLMSTRSQLAYAHLLNRLQHGAVLRMGPFAPLNFETLSHMSRRIYTFVMMLLRMQY